MRNLARAVATACAVVRAACGRVSVAALLAVVFAAPAYGDVSLKLGTPETPTPAAFSAPEFERLSPDGSRLFFTTAEPLAGQPANTAGSLYVNGPFGNEL